MNLKILILLLSLSLSLIFPSIAWTSKKFNGTFKTETIRELWQMCSVTHKLAGVAGHLYYQICDCAIDVMRERFDNESSIRSMSPKESAELAVLVKLNCNEYKLRKDNENKTSQKDSL